MKPTIRPSDVYSYSKETVVTYLSGVGYKITAFRPPREGDWYMELGGRIVKFESGEWPPKIQPGEYRLIIRSICT